MPTNNDDTLFFEGSLSQLTLSLTNIYSGRIIDIDEEKNVNTGFYDGLGGIDTLEMTKKADALFISNNNMQLIQNVEIISAGNGADIINLSSLDYILGDITLSGGNGNDILWGNAGDDVIFGDKGNDILDGGLGNDNLYGGKGNDDISGGAGSDLLSGDKGNDVFYYSSDEIWTSGFYAWNVGSPKDIIDGAIVQADPRNRSHDAFDGGKGHDIIYMTDEGDGLFLDDQYSANPFGGHQARIVDIEEIHAGDGDDIIDLTSKEFSHGDIELYGGDGDDILWSSSGRDLLVGGAGDDHMDGGYGNDKFIVGEGRDKIYGRLGKDKIIYDTADTLIDSIYGFETGKKGDKLDLSDILFDFDKKHSAIDDFVRITDKGKHSQISIDQNGAEGGENFVAIAQIMHINNLDAETLVNQGNLILA